MAFLQSHVVPVVLTERRRDGVVRIRELFGSAFFVDESTFLTARHVIEGAVARATETGLEFALCQKYDEGQSPINVASRIAGYEFAPPPHDVAIGRSMYKTTTMFTIDPAPAHEWQDVATMGYPLSVVDWDMATPSMLGLRCHKGYIQRVIQAGELKIGPAAPAYELSFNISRGLSGSPVFISRHPKDIVVGVCVGSLRSEIVDYERVDVDERGGTFKESRVKIEEYGLAHDLISLHGWRPSILEGKSLLETCHPVR